MPRYRRDDAPKGPPTGRIQARADAQAAQARLLHQIEEYIRKLGIDEIERRVRARGYEPPVGNAPWGQPVQDASQRALDQDGPKA